MSALEEWNERMELSPVEYLDRYGEDAANSSLAHAAIEDMEDAEVPPTAEVDGVEVQVEMWNEQPNYNCVVCPFAALEKQRLAEHMRAQHKRADLEAGEPVNTNRFGKELD